MSPAGLFDTLNILGKLIREDPAPFGMCFSCLCIAQLIHLTLLVYAIRWPPTDRLWRFLPAPSGSRQRCSSLHALRYVSRSLHLYKLEHSLTVLCAATCTSRTHRRQENHQDPDRRSSNALRGTTERYPTCRHHEVRRGVSQETIDCWWRRGGEEGGRESGRMLTRV